MAVTYKDINQLTQKPTVAGTEKIPVSDTQYITPSQVLSGYKKVVYLTSESSMPASPDADTLYVILDDGASTNYQLKSNLVTSISSSSTDTQYPSAKCVYDLLGDVETLINAL